MDLIHATSFITGYLKTANSLLLYIYLADRSFSRIIHNISHPDMSQSQVQGSER